MAALSPRSFLALVIPAIVVAIGYYWFKKRTEESKRTQKQAKKRHKSSSEFVANYLDVVASSKLVDCIDEPPARSECLPPIGAEKSVDDVRMLDVLNGSVGVQYPLHDQPCETTYFKGETVLCKEDANAKVDGVEHFSVAHNEDLPPLPGGEVSPLDLDELSFGESTMYNMPLSKESTISVLSAVTESGMGDGLQQGESLCVNVEEIRDSSRSCAGADTRQTSDLSEAPLSTEYDKDDISESNSEIKQSNIAPTSEMPNMELVKNNLENINLENINLENITYSMPNQDTSNSCHIKTDSYLSNEILFFDSSSERHSLLEGIAEAIEGLKLLDVSSEKVDCCNEISETISILTTKESNVNLWTELEAGVTEQQSLSVVNDDIGNIEPNTSSSSNVGIWASSELQRCSVATDSDINTSAYGTANHSPSEDMLESPAASNFSDIHSEGSTDSGKSTGGHLMPGLEMGPLVVAREVKIYEFEIAQELCGRLIGKQGSTISYIKKNSCANIYIKRHPYNSNLKLCVISGSNTSIEKALQLIRKKFPVNKFSGVSLLQINGPGVPVPDTLQLHLPEGIMCDVILSSLINGGHFFLQQPTHPAYPSLSRLDQDMSTCYTQIATPELPRPVEAGVICAAPMLEGWYRAQVSAVYPESDECDIKFVDYGGYSRLPITSLRQIRSDFMLIPFQASECYLANVIPVDEDVGWTMEAYTTFEELAQGQILQAQVVAYTEDCIPFVHLFRIQGATTTFINRELVTRGVAHWIEHEM